MAADLIDMLPAKQHNELLRTIAQQVIAAVPDEERSRSVFVELADRVAV